MEIKPQFLQIDAAQQQDRNYALRLRLGKDGSDDFGSEVIKEILTDQKQNVQKVKVYEKINEDEEIMKMSRDFGQQTVSSFLKIHVKKISIRKELPKPEICNHCLKFGHLFKWCASNIKSRLKCGSVDHSLTFVFIVKIHAMPFQECPHHLYL